MRNGKTLGNLSKGVQGRKKDKKRKGLIGRLFRSRPRTWVGGKGGGYFIVGKNFYPMIRLQYKGEGRREGSKSKGKVWLCLWFKTPGGGEKWTIRKDWVDRRKNNNCLRAMMGKGRRGSRKEGEDRS